MAMTLGMIASLAHSTPNTSVSFFRFFVAASRIEKTVSPSQLMQSVLSFSSKNWTPSWLARSGMYSIMANRTRHCLSSANWTIAGSRDCERRSMPMTACVSADQDADEVVWSDLCSLIRAWKLCVSVHQGNHLSTFVETWAANVR